MNKQKFIALPFAVLVAMVTFTLVMAAVPALAQNAVPPTAREAAASPAFASRLAKQAAAQTTNKSRALIRPRTASPQDQTLYDNGPYNGTTDAWTINFGMFVSDSFTVPSGSSVGGLHFVYWNASTSDLLTTVDMSLGSTSFGGTAQTLTGVTNTFLGTNQYGYALYQADYSVGNIPWSGPGYVTLSNACTTSGCSVTNPIYWDENGGPSTAYENTLGSIPSETFDLTGSTGLPCFMDKPEDGFKIIHSFSGGQDGATPTNVSVDLAGNLYGATNTAAGGGAGTVFKMAQRGSDWLLSTLYSFAGGYNGGSPSALTIGPYGRLYGPASGGSPNCAGGDCGVVFSVQPQPNACITAPCSWQESVLYRFTGTDDASGPGGKVVFDLAGNLYGMSAYGGAYQRGAIYKLTPLSGGWTETVLYSFTGGTDGWEPTSLVADENGNLYGTTWSGGAYGEGTIYQLTPSESGWTETILYSFHSVGSDGALPTNLVRDSSGNLYGTADWRDGHNLGSVVFMLSPSGGNWVYSVLVLNDGYDYQEDLYSLAIDSAGNLYGTGGGGVVCRGSCREDPNDSPYVFGYIFTLVNGSDGWVYNWPAWFNGQIFPGGGLAIDPQGNLYGVTGSCGTYGLGTVWELTP
jgi:uncharacterized repeat protein (TIGR03803 family)